MAVKILSEAQKDKVVKIREAGRSLAYIAKAFEVSPDTISRVLKERETDPRVYKDDCIVPKGAHIDLEDIIVRKIVIEPGYGTVNCADIYIHDGKWLNSLTRAKDQLAFDDTYIEETLYCSDIKYADIYVHSEHDRCATEPSSFIEKREPVGFAPLVVKRETPVWNANKKFISITVGENTYNADNTMPNFSSALELLAKSVKETDETKANDLVYDALDLINVERAIKSYVKGDMEITGGELFYKGLPIRNGVVDRIIKSMEAGEDFEFYIPFLENLLMNPSRKSVMRLYDFLVANDIEITEDGYFIGWKVVRKDYTDCHTGMFDNSPGQLVVMERNQVDEDDNRTCSSGLHVCSKSYIKHFGGSSSRVVSVKVHPRDVVSIPTDYKDSKMRTCGYLVLEDVTDKL